MFEKLIFGECLVEYYEFIEEQEAKQILDLRNWYSIERLQEIFQQIKDRKDKQ